MIYLVYFVLIISLLNLVRMAAYLILSNMQIVVESFKKIQARKNGMLPKSYYLPTVTVLIPAHNEEVSIQETLTSVVATVYPKSKLSVIVINDGSKDNTAKIVRDFIKTDTSGTRIRLINQKNKGKAGALNYALKRYVSSTLVFCLDADSRVTPYTIRTMVQHFRDRSVIAGSSNVNIMENGSLLSIAQRFEYLISYQMKRTESFCNIGYIIGGIGSMFRYQALKAVGMYDTNTQTEDIDLTLKLISTFGNKNYKFIHAPDAITYTQPVLTLKSLIAQRLRWKYGRWQTFIKNVDMFFSKKQMFSKQLTWFAMPNSLLQELMFLLEPIIILTITVGALYYGDYGTLLSALIVISTYILINTWSSDHLSVKERLRLSYYAPGMYFLLYLLSFAEYLALLSGLFKLREIKESINTKHTTWTSPERTTKVPQV